MNGNSMLIKGASHLLLGVMVYMHVCSAWCAVSAQDSCSSTAKDHMMYSCCHRHTSSHGKNGNCQDYHLSFFNASGQFAPEKSNVPTTLLPFAPAVISYYYIPSNYFHTRELIADNSFHPPPPNADIRILIQSFQI